MVDEVRIVSDNERFMPALIVIFLILLGLGYGVGWKISGGGSKRWLSRFRTDVYRMYVSGFFS